MLHHAADLIEAAPEVAPKKAKRLYRHARLLLLQARQGAGRAAKGRHPKLSTACAVAIQAAVERAAGVVPRPERAPRSLDDRPL
jgi:hypothetical protein